MGVSALLGLASIAAAQPGEGGAARDLSSPRAAPLALRLVGCDEPMDVEALRARVALESSEPPRPGVSLEVELECGAPQVRVRLVEADGRARESRADLGETVGTARMWALAIVLADLLRAEPPPPLAVSPETPDEPESALGPAGALSPPWEPEAPRPTSRSHFSVAAFGRLTFEGGTPIAGASLAYRYDWFRVGVSLGGTQRGHELGQIAAALALLDVGFVPLQHVDPVWSIAGEVYVHGGVLYGAGTPAPSRRGREVRAEAVDLVLGVGAGLRVNVAVDERVSFAAGLRLGIEPYGTEFLAREESLVRVYGPYASLDLGLSFALD